MKGIYGVFKEDLQHSIKLISEKHGISPAEVLTTTREDIFHEYHMELEKIAQRISFDFGIDSETVYEMAENFYSEVNEFICPDFNSTEGNSFTAYLNRQLVEAGYETVEADALNLLIEEIKLALGQNMTDVH